MTTSPQIRSLRDAPDFLDRYVALRNQNAAALLTRAVTGPETRTWLDTADVDLWIATAGPELLGAAGLFYARDAEISIFTARGRTGLGSLLLAHLEHSARRRVRRVWAWAQSENEASLGFFRKNDYRDLGAAEKTFLAKVYLGHRFEKILA